MKIIFLVGSFPPEISTGRLALDLAKSFVRSGHDVTVVTAFPRRYNVSKSISHSGVFSYREKIDGIDVVRMGPSFSNGTNIFWRGFEYFLESLSFLLGGLLCGKVDIIICYSPPLTLAMTSYLLGKVRRAPVIVRVGDLHPQELADAGMIRSKLLFRLLELLEKFAYKKIDFFTVLSTGYQRHLIKKGASANKIRVVPNWGNTEEVEVASKLNQQRSDGNPTFTVTYAGTMSWFQDLATMIDAAFELRNYKDIRFLLLGDGPLKKSLEERSKYLKLDNVDFASLRPRIEYLQALLQSDVCVVSLREVIRTTTIPSKLLDIMACGRPVIANVPRGEASDIVSEARCGIWVGTQDPKSFAKAILTLYEDRGRTARLGWNARQYLEDHFSLHACVREHQEILQIVSSHKSREKS